MQNHKNKKDLIELSLLLGPPRSWKPVMEGQCHLLALRVLRNPGPNLQIAYQFGVVQVAEKLIKEDAPIERTSMTFIPRSTLHLEDRRAYKLLEERMDTELTIALANYEKRDRGELVHRLVIKNQSQ
jgi:hypothetical protein